MTADRTTRVPETTVVAVTADDDRYATSRRAAMDLAKREGAELILYDWESPMLLGDPLPSVWSADGTDTAVPDRLDEEALGAAGRAEIARQVGEAKAAGLRATAWLPSEKGSEALLQYARDHRAIGIVVPRDLAESDDLKGSLAGSESADGIRVVVA
jgi:hypothetical protein